MPTLSQDVINVKTNVDINLVLANIQENPHASFDIQEDEMYIKRFSLIKSYTMTSIRVI